MRRLLIVLVVLAPILAAAIVLIPLFHPAAAPVRHAQMSARPAATRRAHHLKETLRRG
ncbi:MAG TPA: hypothetical protein VG166_12605 [Caulobacteraceae bacterium]|nr:hypothetical protein [Caulobacteraceae bacterium]